MKILSIETSCDETAVALLECSGSMDNPSFKVLGDTVLSQAMKHAEFGGVYPHLAKREHSKNLVPVLIETLKKANFLYTKSEFSKSLTSNLQHQISTILEREPILYDQFTTLIPTIKKPDLDAIAVTHGPGLEPALWVGVNFARALSLAWDVPLIPVNHMEGHIVSVLIDKAGEAIPLHFPALALLISGGHTELVLVRDWMQYEIIGRTRDDAVGEAFDKVARLLGLGYPGGPEVSKYAEAARTEGRTPPFTLPRPMKDSGDYDFSFSGIKTAVLYKVKTLGKLDEKIKQDIARAFEDSVVDVLTHKTRRALDEYAVRSLIIGGGVIANRELREAFENLVDHYPNTALHIPELYVTGDNAVMIGVAGYFRALKNDYAAAPHTLRADGNLRLDNA